MNNKISLTKNIVIGDIKMARIVKHEEKAPMGVKVGGESKWICMCGLSKNKPFCDGSHKLCSGEEEGKLYKYEDGKRIEVKDA